MSTAIPPTRLTNRTSILLECVDKVCRHSESDEQSIREVSDLVLESLSAKRVSFWLPRESSRMERVVLAGRELHPKGQIHSNDAKSASKCLDNRLPSVTYSESETECTLLFPVYTDHQWLGLYLVTMEVASKLEAEVFLAIIQSAVERLNRHLTHSSDPHTASETASSVSVQQLFDGVTSRLDSVSHSMQVVNQLRDFLNVDRVSLAYFIGEKCVVKAVSNQAAINRRSNTIRTIERLAASVAKIEKELWLPTDREFAPIFKSKIDSYLDTCNSVGAAFIPIFAVPKRRMDPKDIAATIQPDIQTEKCVAVLVIENMTNLLDAKQVNIRWQSARTVVSNTVGLAREHDSLFLMPVWKRLGVLANWYRGHTRRKALLITGAILFSLLALFTIPADFKLRGDGIIQPTNRRSVFAEVDGTIEQSMFVDGEQVKKGQQLFRLSNPELQARLAEVEGRLGESRAALRTIMAQRAIRSFGSEEEKRQVIRSTSVTEARIAGLEKQQQMLRDAVGRLTIASPLSGNVLTWDSKQRLTNRPVKKGERLVVVATPDGQWEIELRIPDKRAGYLLKRWQQCVQQEEGMYASVVLASNTRNVYPGRVLDVAPASNVDQEDKENVVRVKIGLEQDVMKQLALAKPGTTVIGHVHVGKTSYGYSKIYEFFDWTRRMWFRYIS